MAKNRHSYSLKSNNKCSSPSERRFSERLSQGYRVTRRDLHFESLEERMLLSINTGDPTEHDFHGSVLTAWLPDGTTREDLENQLTATNLKASVQSSLSRSLRLANILETEQNNKIEDSNALSLGFDPGENTAIDVSGSLSIGDADFYRLTLEPGDIVGANVSGAGTQLGFRRIDVDDDDEDGDVDEEIFLIGSGQDLTFGHPTASPLPGGGNAAMSWVVDTAGDYYLDVSGEIGSYSLNLRLFRPVLESEAVGDGQILFLDFDGATIDTSIFGEPGDDTMVTLSPLSSFLTNWGLTADDENAVINAIVASVTENLSTDIRLLGNNGNFDTTGNPGDFDIEILNSRDHDDPFGLPNVSRVIVGGTVEEFGIAVIGIAESIDVGNFETKETAVTLLDILSGPADDPGSLNQYELDADVSIIDLIGVGVGNITAHETGHFFAAWHTDQFNIMPNIMDQDGNLDSMLGLVGPVWGDGDEIDVDFGDDTFVPNEGFTGTEDTLNAIAFGLSTGVFADVDGPQLISISPNNGEVLVDGETRNLAPQELTFRFNDGEIIDPDTLDGIQIMRAGKDGVFDGNDVIIVPGFIGIGEQPNEVIFRFSDALPDDLYHITIFGTGVNPLTNTNDLIFNDGVDFTLDFTLDLGAKIIAVVPEPTNRDTAGNLTQARDQIVIYFNNDDLHPTAVATGEMTTDPTVVDPQFYQLIFTNNTITNTDDVIFNPTSISYDPVNASAVLTFVTPLAELSTGPGTYRLRIGTNERLPQPPTTITIGAVDDPGSSFDTAYDLGAFGTESQIITSALEPVQFPLDFPGRIDEPGHREILMNDHLSFGADAFDGIGTIAYNFRSDYGFDPSGNELFNLINPAQKELARHIFELFSTYLGIEFVETENEGLTVATGDLRALNSLAESGPNGAALISATDQTTIIPEIGLTIINGGREWDDTYGGDWFNQAFTGIGQLLRMSYTEELPPKTIAGEDFDLLPDSLDFEPIYPGDHDIVHGRHLYRPEGNDIDLYQFSVTQQGVFTAETFAERLEEVSQLDTVISLYQQLGYDYRLISRNDDYYSEDSFVELDLIPGTYLVGITASGNRAFDPTVEDSGNHGTSDGDYQLRLNFRPVDQATIVDSTGTALDGDADGTVGGIYNFWFRTQSLENVLFVDKSAIGGPMADGSLQQPFRQLDRALAAAETADDPNDPNDDNIVRIVANGGTDNDLVTVDDAQAFEFGFNELGQPLQDGATVKIPRGVALMVDAGVVFKAQDGAIEVGSSAPGLDRSGGVAQILGTPDLPVYFTSFNDESIGQDTNVNVEQIPLPGDWGGIIFRNDLDRASPDRVHWEDHGIFLNYVNHADIRFGGGPVEIDSRQQIVTPLQMVDARPTLTFNSITFSSDAAISASPNSFEETNFHTPQFQSVAFTSDYDRVGPEIYGNELFSNTTNGLFIRIRTPAGDVLQPLTVSGRFDDTDVVHVLAENLVIQGTPGGPTGSLIENNSEFTEDSFDLEARLDARLAIDPRTIIKLNGAHIDVKIGAQLIAEGLDSNRVIFTSLSDDTFGVGGNFDTTSDGDASLPAQGDWGGLYFGPVSSGSIDHALFRYGGGITRVESEFAGFNVVEIQQGDVRLTNNIFEFNAVGTGGQAPANRFGLQDNTDATIFVRGSQSVIVDNIVRHNDGPAINVNVNSLNHFLVSDFGRSTGPVNLIDRFEENQGLLVRNNVLFDNSINGMVVRGATLTTQSVWDDTDVVHVLFDEVIVPDFHTYGGLRLESSPNESLVVKLSGPQAGFTAAGRPLDIDDRIGGSLHIIGQPDSPVVITSLADDTVGAGLLFDGTPNNDTGNDSSARSTRAGDWRSVLIQEYANDRNVAVHTEQEPFDLDPPGSNSNPEEAEFLGSLAPGEKHSDDNLRLGFEIHGYLSEPSDIDVYSFQADAGTLVWFDIDRTSPALDTVIELLDSNGTVVARSDNSFDEASDSSLLFGIGQPMQQRPPYNGEDYFATNPKDAGMLLALQDAAGTNNTYHVRVRSSSDNIDDLNGGKTSGVYQLQIRVQETDEIPGSNVRYTHVRFATNGIEIQGQPTHSPLLGEASEDDTPNDTFDTAQDLGNYLVSERGTINVTGQFLGNDYIDIEDFDPENFALADLDLIDFYRFEVLYGDIQHDGQAEYASTIFDLDYADGFSRPDPILFIFDSRGQLILTSSNANVTDDRPVSPDGDIDDLSRGSLGPLDPYIGSVALPEGVYFAAVSAASQVADELSQFFVRNASNPLLRLEPINSVVRIAEEHFGGLPTTAADPIVPVLIDETNVVPFSLADVILFVSTDTDQEESQLHQVDPFSGTVEVDYPETGIDVGDIAMLYDGTLGGELFSFRLDLEDDNGGQDDTAGNYIQIDTGSGAYNVVGDDEINTFQANDAGDPEARPDDPGLQGIHFEALTFSSSELGYAVGNSYFGQFITPPGVELTENILYSFDPANGVVNNNPDEDRLFGAGTDAIEVGHIITNVRIHSAPGEAIEVGDTFTIDGIIFEFVSNNSSIPTNPLAISVPFSNDDSAMQIALAIQDAINSNLAPAVSATTDFANIIGDPPIVNVLGALNAAEVTGALTTEGDGGPGGTITGIASSSNRRIFAVSDEGGLYAIFGSDAPPGELADYIDSSAADLNGINFAGLTFGPDGVEGGAFADILFSITQGGTLHAFDTEGVLKPVFVDGQTNVPSGLYNVQGLAFGSLDENLWHQTGRRNTDAGHGIRQPFDRTRLNRTGGSSFYFGRDFPNEPIFDYDTPGGSHGVLISNPFDLSEYMATDRPTLYFNYLALTENVDYSDTPTPMRDSFRVYASDGSGILGSGQWHLMATNNSFRDTGDLDDEYDDPIADLITTDVQELHDFTETPGTWRQVRIPLDTFAGRKNVRLRFEFATAGSVDFGNPETTGSELRAVVGSELRDGATFSIDFNTFEFDSGFTIELPSAPLLTEGDTITIDGRTDRRHFEFDSDGVVNHAIFVPRGSAFRDGDTFRVTDGVATALFEIESGFSIIVPPAGGNPFLGGVVAGDQFVINDNAGSGDIVFQFTKSDLPGTGDVNIEIDDLNTRDQIANLIVLAIANANLDLRPVNLGSGEVLIGGNNHTLNTDGSLFLRQRGEPGTQNGGIPIPISPWRDIDRTDMATLIAQTINQSGLDLTATAPDFELVLEGNQAALIPGTSPLSPMDNVAVDFVATDNSAHLAKKLGEAIANSNQDHTLTTTGSLLTLPGNILLLPLAGGNPVFGDAIDAGDQFVLNDNSGSGDIIFEFTKNSQPATGDISIEITDFTTQHEAAERVVAAVANSRLGLSPINLGGGQVFVGGTPNVIPHVNQNRINLENALLVTVDTDSNIGLDGQPGIGDFTTVRVPIHEGMTRQEVTNQIANRFAANFAFNQQIVARDGSRLVEGQLITINDGVNTLIAEFDTGYTMQSPDTGGAGIADGETFTITNIIRGTEHAIDTLRAPNLGSSWTILVPAHGGNSLQGGVNAGDQFVINNNNGSGNVVFEFTKGGQPGQGAINIEIDDTNTQDELADLIVAAIQGSADLGLTPENVGNGRVLVGGLAHKFDLSGTLNLLSGFDIAVPVAGGNPFLGGIEPGYQFIINDNLGSGDVIFQFTQDGFPGTGDFNIEITEHENRDGIPTIEYKTQDEIANGIVDKLENAGLGLTAENQGDGLVTVGATTHSIRAISSVNLARGFTMKVPATGGDPSSAGVRPGDQFIINDNKGSGDVIFQFTQNDFPGTGDINIEINAGSTQDEIANLIVAAIENSGIGLQTSYEGEGEVVLGGHLHSLQATGNMELWRGDKLQVPAMGGDPVLGISHGQEFVLNDNSGGGDVVFQFTKNSLPGTGDFIIDISDTSTQNDIAELIVVAIQNTGMGLSPVNLGNGDVFVGGITHTLDTSRANLGSTITLLVPDEGGNPFTGGLTASQEFVINDNAGSGDVVFQFTKNTLPGTGDINIDINNLSTQDTIANQIVNAVRSADLDLLPIHLGDGRVVLGGVSLTFEFDKDFTNDGTNSIIVLDTPLNVHELNARVASAINAAPVDLLATALPSGILHIGGTPDVQIVNRSGMDLSGQPGAQTPGATAIAFMPDRNFTGEQTAMATAAVINASDLEITATVADRRIQLFGTFGNQVSIGQGQTNGNDRPIPVTTNVAVPENGDIVSSALETGLLPGSVATFIANANIDDSLDVDFFAVDLEAGDNITIDIDASSVGSSLDSILQLFDANGFQVAFNTYGAASDEFFSFDSYIDYTAITSGRYFVGVSGLFNFSYDPFVAESGILGDNSTGPYQIHLTINDPRASLQLATPLLVEDAIGTSKEFNDVMRVIGHDVFNEGDLGLADYMWADQFGVFDSTGIPQRIPRYTEENITALAAQNNLFEGIYIDDIIIGLAGRGEMVVDAESNTAFPAVTSFEDLPDTEILQGPYQFEIRRGAEYGSPLGNGNAVQMILERTFDYNDRLIDAPTIVAPQGSDIVSGQTFSLSDGIHEVTFLFEENPPIVESFGGGVTVPETGDVISTAIETELPPGGDNIFFARAEIEDPSDIDFFAIDLNVGDSITVDIDARILGARVDSMLRIFDETGMPLALADDVPAPGEAYTFDPFIPFTATIAGRYYVGVSNYPNYNYDPFLANRSALGWSTGPYEITIILNGGQNTTPDIETISNDFVISYFSDNTDIEVAKLIEAAINRDIVQDVFSVRAVSNLSSARVDLSGGITVSAGFGTRLAEPNDTIPQAVDSGIVPGGNGTFRGRGELLDPIRNRSNIIDLGDFQTRTFDVDLIRLDLDAGETISIDTDTLLEQGWTTDTIVRVFNATGVQLAVSDNDLAPDELPPTGVQNVLTLESYLEFTAFQAGTYYVGISGGSGLGLGSIFGTYGGNFSFGGNNFYDPNERDSGSRGSRGSYSIEISRDVARADGIDVIFHEDFGDQNHFRDQGQLIIESNVISDSENFGISVTAGERIESPDSLQPHPGPVRATPTLNSERLIPGVTITNNVVVFNGSGGILFSGDTNPANGQLAPIPFGRLLNNTLFGTAAPNEVGVQIQNNASPTLLNNILANLGTGLSVDASSLSSVLGGLLYQDNLVNSVDGLLGDSAIDLDDTAPLFVNPGGRNFYPAAGSSTIDSAVNSLEDRPEMIRVREPLGIAPSPILAPERDLFGSLRLDDPDVLTPAGLGEIVFTDRGAIDRNDFDGPTIELISPPDGDGNTFATSLSGPSKFVMRINDNSTGVADSSVNSDQIVIERNDTILELGVDYTFQYDETNNLIRLTSGPVIWPDGDYQITIDNAAETGIKDVANNPLQANQPIGTVVFTIEIGPGTDFGDAPQSHFATLRPDGAHHEIVQGFFLGFAVDADDDGSPSHDANADAFDDGVTFNTDLIIGSQASITVRASSGGLLDAFLGNVQIFTSELLNAGPNTLTFTVPDDIGAVDGQSYFRFRLSSEGGLGPDGPAIDGEVEDYLVHVDIPSWQNLDNHLDVNGNGVVSAQDILLLSNFLYFNGQQRVPDGLGEPPFPVAPPPYYDVNGNNFVDLQDALLVVSALRANPPGNNNSLVGDAASATPSFPTETAENTNTDQPNTETAIESSNEGIPPAFFFEETTIQPALKNGATADPILQDNTNLDQDVVIENLSTDATGAAANRVSLAVDQVLSEDFRADNLDFVHDSSPTVRPAAKSNTLDDFYATFEDIE